MKLLCEFCQRKQARIRFCSNKCKDKYHNTRNPRGIFKHLSNTNGISFHETGMDSREYGWDGHKDTF